MIELVSWITLVQGFVVFSYCMKELHEQVKSSSIHFIPHNTKKFDKIHDMKQMSLVKIIVSFEIFNTISL